MTNVSHRVNQNMVLYLPKKVPVREKRKLLRAYRDSFGRGMLQLVAQEADVDPSAVSKTWRSRGAIYSKRIHALIEAHLAKLSPEAIAEASPALAALQEKENTNAAA